MASTGMNRVTLIGRVEGATRLSRTSSGKSRLWLKLHCAEEVPDDEGVPRRRQAWVPIVVWGARAEGLAKILTHGRRVAVDGRLVHWKREQADRVRWETHVHVNELVLLEGDELAPSFATRSSDAA